MVRGRVGGQPGHARGRLHARAAHGIRPQGETSAHDLRMHLCAQYELWWPCDNETGASSICNSQMSPGHTKSVPGAMLAAGRAFSPAVLPNPAPACRWSRRCT